MPDYRCLNKNEYLGRILMLPASTRDLLTYCILLADDRGITNAYAALKLTGAREQEIKVLVEANLLHILRKEDMIVYVINWELHNGRQRSDRMIESKYFSLLQAAFPEKNFKVIKERADVKAKKIKKLVVGGRPVDDQWTTNGRPKEQEQDKYIYNNNSSSNNIDNDNLENEKVKNLPKNVVAVFEKFGIDKSKWEELSTYTEQRILDVAAVVNSKKNVQNPSGLFISMLEKNWALPVSNEEMNVKKKKELNQYKEKASKFCLSCNKCEDENIFCSHDGMRIDRDTLKNVKCEYCEVV